MSPLEVLDALRSGDTRARNEAAAGLQSLLSRLATIPLSAGHSRGTHLVVIPSSERADIVSDVTLRVIRGIELKNRTDGAATDYLKKMLARYWLTRRKRMQREPVGPSETEVAERLDRAGAHTVVDEPARDTLQRGRALVERVMAAVLERLTPRYREDQSRVFAQLMEITFDGGDFRTVVHRDEPAPDANRLTVEAAAYKRHQRARDRLLETISAMLAAGQLNKEEAAIAKAVVCDFLVRCQRSAARVVKPHERSAEENHD
jgi:hypothetical protein